jgi:hypothetical protein
VILQNPVALHTSDFVFCFYAVCVQRRLIFSRRFPIIDTTCDTNRPSSGVEVIVMKESAVHCNVVVLFLCSCVGLLLQLNDTQIKQLVNPHKQMQSEATT